MSDLSTFTRFKDWMIIALLAAVVSLLGVVAADNRRRIDLLETKAERIDAQAARLASLEAGQQSQREETFRRLERIEDKLDRLGSRSKER